MKRKTLLAIGFILAAVPSFAADDAPVARWDMWNEPLPNRPAVKKKVQEAAAPAAAAAQPVAAAAPTVPATDGSTAAVPATVASPPKEATAADAPAVASAPAAGALAPSAPVSSASAVAEAPPVTVSPSLLAETPKAPSSPERTLVARIDENAKTASAHSSPAVEPPVDLGVKETSEAGPAGTVPVGVSAEYRIGSGDVLDISVWKDEALTRTVVILPDGTFTFPLIHTIKAVGRTVADVRAEMEEKLAQYVPELVLSVEVKQSNSMMIYVIGRVNQPGRLVLNANVDVLQALSMAGGLNAFARRDNIKVFRKENGGTTTIPFRYSDVVDGKSLESNIELKRGDVIVVP